MALTRPRITQFDTTTTVLSDPITVLHGGATSANVDVGFLFNRANGLISNVALYWSESNQSFITGYTSSTGITDSNIALSGYANIRVGAITAGGFFYSNGAAIGGGIGSSGGGSGTAITYTAGISPPLGPNFGDIWYNTTTNVIYTYTNDGIGNYWLDTEGPTAAYLGNVSGLSITGPFFINGTTITNGNIVAGSGTASTSTVTGALVVVGGTGVSGNLTVGGTISSFIGNVGIGTTAPAAKLDVYQLNATTTEHPVKLRIISDYGSATTGGFGGGLAFVDRTPGNLLVETAKIESQQDIGNNAGSLIFYTNGGGGNYASTERARINSSGNFGIGVIPTTKLTVQGDGQSVLFQSATATASEYQTIKNGTGRIDLGIESSLGTAFWTGGTPYSGVISVAGAYPLVLGTNGVERLRVSSVGNVTITASTASTNATTGALQVAGGIGVSGSVYISGSLFATTKSFLIDHPTKPDMKLRYGSLEGPENGVYIRGKITNSNQIDLPDYWVELVDPSSITVQLTPYGKYQKLFVKEIKNNKIIIGSADLLNKLVDCYYIIFAERSDVDKLIVEIDNPLEI